MNEALERIGRDDERIVSDELALSTGKPAGYIDAARSYLAARPSMGKTAVAVAVAVNVAGLVTRAVHLA